MWSLDSFAEVSAWSLSHPSLTSGLSLKPPCHISVILTVFQIFTLFFMVIFGVRYHEVWVSLAAQLVKNLPAMQEAWVGMPVRAPKTPRGECPPGTELAEGQGRGAPERLWQERRRVPSERSIRVGEPIASTIPGAAQEGSRGWGRAHKQELRPGSPAQPQPRPLERLKIRSERPHPGPPRPLIPCVSKQRKRRPGGQSPQTACKGGVLTASGHSRLP